MKTFFWVAYSNLQNNKFYGNTVLPAHIYLEKKLYKKCEKTIIHFPFYYNF